MATSPVSKPLNPIVLLQNVIGSASKSSYSPDDLAVDISYTISRGYVKGWDMATEEDKNTVLQLLVAVYEGIEVGYVYEAMTT